MNIIGTAFWDEYARLYSMHTPSFQKELLEYVSKFSRGRVIDAGTGVGKLLPYLQDTSDVTEILGFDISSQMLSLAKANVREKDLDKVKRLELLELENLARFRDFLPDTIVSLNVIYSLSNPISFFRNAYNSLNKNGRLIISSQLRSVNLKQIITVMNNEFEGERDYLKFCEMQKEMADKSVVSPSCYSKEEIGEIFELIGFKVIDLRDDHYLNSNFTIVGVKK